jgi:8-oxo-dGTP diphosphatase
MGRYVYDYPRPMVTVDAAVFTLLDGTARLLLIRRKHEPYKDHWALPGGFLEMDEDLKEAAARELAEETGLKNVPLEQLHTFGKPGRDPRGRTITVVYFGIAGTDWPQIEAADDAADAQWFDIESLPEMAFDHDEITRCAIERLKQTQARQNHRYFEPPTQ